MSKQVENSIGWSEATWNTAAVPEEIKQTKERISNGTN